MYVYDYSWAICDNSGPPPCSIVNISRSAQCWSSCRKTDAYFHRGGADLKLIMITFYFFCHSISFYLVTSRLQKIIQRENNNFKRPKANSEGTKVEGESVKAPLSNEKLSQK